jgi:hypothetical protein
MASSTPGTYLLRPTTRRWIYFPFTCKCWSYWFCTLSCKCNSFLHAGVEAGDEAHRGPWDLSDQGAAPSRGGGSIGCLRIHRPGTGSVATRHPTSSKPCQSRTDWTSRAGPQCTATAWTDMSARCRGWYERLIISVLNFYITNLFNSVLQRKCTGVQPHYFDVWEHAHQGNPDAAQTLVTINFYSYAILVSFIHNSIFL